MNGYGEFEWKDGRVFRGNYRKDKKEGYGEYFYSDGRSYRGEWKDDLQHGIGFYTNKQGLSKQALWQTGKRLEWIQNHVHQDQQQLYTQQFNELVQDHQ